MPSLENLPERSRSFGLQADLYDRVRPGYPPAALDAILAAGARRVADIGAGTGKLTRALAARGLTVIAVEPDEAMRSVLAARVPVADVRAGAAEALPLADGEVDAVAFAQSWHWVDAQTAAREAARVLVPGGLLAMLWNLPDDRVPWVGQLDEMTGARAGVSRHPEQAPALEGFGPARRVDVAWQQTLRPEDLVDLTRTWSSVITLGPAERERMVDAVRDLVATDAALAGRDEIAYPYVCAVRTYRLLPAGGGVDHR
jgi:SAM-dependent methyltransferase